MDLQAEKQARKGLLSLSLVSPSFRSVAQVLLFRSFQEYSINLDNTVSFARALCTNPPLRENVKELVFLPFFQNKNGVNEFSSSNHNFFKNVIDRHGLSDLQWIPKLHQREVDFFAAFVAIQTPQVTKLSLKGDSSLAPLVQASKRVHPFLPNLGEVTVLGNWNLAGFDIGVNSGIYSLFSKLNVVSFKYGSLLGLGETFNYEAGTLDTEHIKFEMCHMTLRALHKVMRAHKKLSSFTYSNFDPILGMRPLRWITGVRTDRHFDAAEALEAVLIHKESLQTLHLTFGRDREDHMCSQGGTALLRNYYSTQTKFGSFAPFNQLKTIIVTQSHLRVHPEFPGSIEKIEITDCIAPIEDLMSNIASDCTNGKYPALTAISIAISHQYHAFFRAGSLVRAPRCGRIQSWFSGVDIKFTYYEPWGVGRGLYGRPGGPDGNSGGQLSSDARWLQHRNHHLAFEALLRRQYRRTYE